MRMPRSLLPPTLAAAVAAVVAAPAAASYAPRLSVAHEPQRPGSAATTIRIVERRDDEPTAKIAVYVPLGYEAAVAASPGEAIGTVTAWATGPNGRRPFGGVIRADAPESYADDPAALSCIGTTPQSAVWALELTSSGRTVRLPVFVSPVDVGEASAVARYVLQLCLPRPGTPESAGGIPFGDRLLVVTLKLDRSFTAPVVAGEYVWRGVFTPYRGVPPEAAGRAAVEARALVRLPARLNLRAIRKAVGRVFALAGSVVEAGVGVPGVRVAISHGRTPGVLSRFLTPRTRRSGEFRTPRLRLRRTTYFRATATVPQRDATRTGGCRGGSLAPRGCVTATLAPYELRSRIVIVKP